MAKGKSVVPLVHVRSIPIYESVTQFSQPVGIEENSQFKTLEFFINVMTDDYNILIQMPDVNRGIQSHDIHQQI